MRKLIVLIMLAVMLVSCTTADLYYASVALDMADAVVDLMQLPWMVSRLHWHRPPLPRPPHRW